jgi:hypothetical protein
VGVGVVMNLLTAKQVLAAWPHTQPCKDCGSPAGG